MPFFTCSSEDERHCCHDVAGATRAGGGRRPSAVSILWAFSSVGGTGALALACSRSKLGQLVLMRRESDDPRATEQGVRVVGPPGKHLLVHIVDQHSGTVFKAFMAVVPKGIQLGVSGAQRMLNK